MAIHHWLSCTMVVAHVRLEDGGTFRLAHDPSRYDTGRDDDAAVADFLRLTSSSNFVAFNRPSWLRFIQIFRQTPVIEIYLCCY